ncbi:MAG TPA: ABC transporter permease [Blastocatellia bacterium]|nr:ABC transporter permease [Blastocatellia bacterium]
MNKIAVIIKREYLTRVRTKGFIIGTIASPLLLLAIALLPVFLATRGGGERSVTVLDQSGDPGLFQAIGSNLKSQAEEAGQSQSGRPRVVGPQILLSQEVVGPDKEIDDVRRQYNSEVEKNTNKAYVVLRPGVLSGVKPEYYARNLSDSAIRRIERSISQAIAQRRLEMAGLDSKMANEYIKPVEMITFRLSGEGESQEGGFQVFQVAFVMLFFIYVTVLAYGIAVMRGVIEEKQSRIVEIIVSSVKPAQMMLGKLVGIGLVGLTQYLIWVLSTLLLSVLGASVFAAGSFNFPNIPVSLLAYFVIYFVLGYFLFATIYVVVGAMVTSEEEAQNVQFPIIMLLAAPMILFGIVLNNPSSPTAVALSLVPFFTPTLMLIRIVVATPPLWQILLSMLIMVVTILAAVWVAARIYRVGILMYGKRPNIAELGRWLRYT